MLAAAKAGANPDARGKLYEALLKYVFESVIGTRVVANETSFFKAEQVDLAVANGGGFPELPQRFLVECKNYEVHVDSKAVGYFLFICLTRKVDLAVVVAANGLTGHADELSHAHSLAQGASALGCKLIVTTDADLLGLTCSDDLVALLSERYLKAWANGGIGAA